MPELIDEIETNRIAATSGATRKADTVRLFMSPNDTVERRGASPASNEGTLSQSSTLSLVGGTGGPAIARTDCKGAVSK